MEARYKAKELVDYFMEVNREQRYQDDLNIFEAKQCALICVDEILKNQPYDIYTIHQCNNLTKYWQEVKQEINKL
jgi:hypothetical protein